MQSHLQVRQTHGKEPTATASKEQQLERMIQGRKKTAREATVRPREQLNAQAAVLARQLVAQLLLQHQRAQ